MNQGKYVFSQLTDFLPRYQFRLCVDRHKGEHRIRTLSCWDQLLCMMFGQLADIQSLRDVVLCLQSHRHQLYHLGFQSQVYLPTLAKANEKRNWMIYRDYLEILIPKTRRLYSDDTSFTLDLDNTVYVLDSSIVNLCLKYFSWAKFRKNKAAVKIHALLDLRGILPVVVIVTPGNVHDVNILDEISVEMGAYYVMDRAYCDYKRLYAIHKDKAFFITRAKKNMAWKRLYSNMVDKTAGLRCDQVIRFTGCNSRKKYPELLRRIKYYDKETDRYYVFLTNDMTIGAQLVAELYKNRWQVEIFFKWIKQNLRIKRFYGHSLNAVMTQICISMCVYLVVAMLKKQLKTELSMHEILQILSISLFDKTRINTLLSSFVLQDLEPEPSQPALLLDF